jgi:hypothetical protein
MRNSATARVSPLSATNLNLNCANFPTLMSSMLLTTLWPTPLPLRTTARCFLRRVADFSVVTICALEGESIAIVVIIIMTRMKWKCRRGDSCSMSASSLRSTLATIWPWRRSPCRPTQRWLAYLVDRVGDERYELRVRSLDTLIDSPPLAVCHENLHWLASRSAVACTVLDDVYSQPLLIRLVDIGDGASFANVSARIIFNQTSPEFALELSASDSGAVLIAASQGQVTSDIRYMVLSDDDIELRTLLPARHGVQMWPLHVALGESANAPAFAWIARTNMGDAPNYRIVAAKSHLARRRRGARRLARADRARRSAMLMDMQWLPRSGSLVVLRLRDVDVEACVTQIDARFDDPQRPWMIATGPLFALRRASAAARRSGSSSSSRSTRCTRRARGRCCRSRTTAASTVSWCARSRSSTRRRRLQCTCAPMARCWSRRRRASATARTIAATMRRSDSRSATTRCRSQWRATVRRPTWAAGRCCSPVTARTRRRCFRRSRRTM